jgi:HK97 family phage major capsid protein
MFKMAFKKIQEIIGTWNGTPGTLLIPKLIMPELIQAVEKTLIPREMAAKVWGPSNIQGSSFSVNLETPNTLLVRQVGEGAEIPLDAMDFTSVTFTPVKYGVAVRITREMMEDSQFELLQRNIRTAGIRLAENETKLILGQLDSANSTVAGGASITIANITEAMYNIEGADADYKATDFLFGKEVLNDLRNIDTFVEANKAGNTEMLSRGFIGTLYGMNCATFSSSTTVVPAAANAKYGYVFDRSQAYGIAIKRDITVEGFVLPSFDMDGAAITQRIAVKLLRSTAVSRITTA